MKVAIIGLDTSHCVELPRLMKNGDAPEENKIMDLEAVTCLRFPSPFQTEEGQDGRQAQLEKWGVKVTRDFDEAVADCEAIMLEVNDPDLHLKYFQKVVDLGKPVFLDKPLAGTLADGREIIALARQHNVKVWSGSSLPFAPIFDDALGAVPADKTLLFGHCFGPLGKAPSGDSLIWYGVHTFEMLQKLMGRGPETVRALDNGVSVVASIDYGAERRGLVELIRGQWSYGGRTQWAGGCYPFAIPAGALYRNLLQEVSAFFHGGPAPVSMETTFEGLAMMIAANESLSKGGAPVQVAKLEEA